MACSRKITRFLQRLTEFESRRRIFGTHFTRPLQVRRRLGVISSSELKFTELAQCGRRGRVEFQRLLEKSASVSGTIVVGCEHAPMQQVLHFNLVFRVGKSRTRLSRISARRCFRLPLLKFGLHALSLTA